MKTAFVLTLLLACASGGSLGGAPLPRTFLIPAAAIADSRRSLDRGESSLQAALTSLRAEADAALALRPLSVMDKPLTAASGDKHDYFSYGPYWWPDPAKADGLPFIRRDGEVNPASRDRSDYKAFAQVSTAIETLGLAYWFTRDERYARQAARLARVWFLDPATRMNPHLQHAQAIPGLTDGRGIGIIESRQLISVNEGLALLAGSSAWNPADRAAYQSWLAAFYEWLTTSPNGRDEQREHNNHGTWYDAQVAHLALVLDRPADAAAILAAGLTRRLAAHITPDGAQPHELARTKSLDYSLYNLDALFACAELARHVGLDWWSYTTSDGRSLRAALVYLAPYIDPAKPWPKPDLHDGDRSRLVPLLDQFLHHRDDPALRKILAPFASSSAADSRWRLIHNRPLSAAPGSVEVEAPARKRYDVTPLSLPGSEPHVFREADGTELRLHVVKPTGWSRANRRPCLVAFFGGGWNSGTPASSIRWAEWAATLGLVGVAPDYRTRDRLGGTPEDCIADGRAALGWIVAHAAELGIDPARIIVLGGSAGGHVAAWTAIPFPGPAPGDPAPALLPAALILLNPVTDTKAGGYGGPKRFGGDAARALACSVTDQMPARMPPALVFHATADTTVPYANSTAFRDKLIRQGNRCDLITFEGLGHSYTSTKYGPAGRAAEEKTKREATAFLLSLDLLPTPESLNP
ncbi:MAG: alginate lyase family protein [Lacunisphaera sp.]|nr:alginate lyase family protein [Lacunisphaera sp.]